MRQKTRTKLAIRDTLHLLLVTAAEVRDPQAPVVDGPLGPEFAWVASERRGMLAAVNVHRADFGLDPVDEVTVARLEQQAAGHVDYAAKYALLCAELAVGER